jgi:predicted metal-dependent HD superfamily phosphohydrolase
MWERELKWTFWGAVRDALGEGEYSQFEELKVTQLVSHYDEDGREYHGIGHIGFIIDKLKEMPISEKERALMIIAAWFHDYDRYSVQDSAEEATTFMEERGFPQDDMDFVYDMIMSTKSGAVPHNDYHIALRQAQFRDCDRLILAQPPPTYNRYVALLETEYSIDYEIFSKGRITWLEEHAYRPVFWLPETEEKYGDIARANMQREITWRKAEDE